MLSDFRAFIMRGNVLGLAVGVIIGAAFGAIVTSLTEDIIMPVVGAVTGGIDFSSHFVLLGDIPASYTGSPTDYAALKKAGVPLIGWGHFLTVVVGFLILAFIIFLIVRAAARVMKEEEAAGPTEEVLLLRDIRDSLRNRP
jgi:large conductance mechanosensitive channel